MCIFEGGLRLGGATTTTTTTTTAATGIPFAATAPLQLSTTKTTAPASLTLGSAATTTTTSGFKLVGTC